MHVRSFQRDARAEPARPDDGTASGALWRHGDNSNSLDRSFQTDARAEPARPDDGTASGAYACAAAIGLVVGASTPPCRSKVTATTAPCGTGRVSLKGFAAPKMPARFGVLPWITH